MQPTVTSPSDGERRGIQQDSEYPSDEEQGFGAKPRLSEDNEGSDDEQTGSLLSRTPPPPAARKKKNRSYAFLANIGVSPTASTSGSLRTFTSGSSSTDEDDDTFADMSRATTQDHYLNGMAGGRNKDAALCLALLCSGAVGDHGGMMGVSGPMVSLMDSDSTKSLFDLEGEEGDDDDFNDEDEEDFQSSFST